MADMLMSYITGRAVTTMVKRPDHHTLTWLKIGYICTYAVDSARHFMADNTLKSDTAIHIAMEDMHICTANTAIGNADTYFTCGRCRLFYLLNAEAAIAPIEGGCHHLFYHFVVSLGKMAA